ncbi:MAG TPA: response regulator [Allocoleopsis sp.]
MNSSIANFEAISLQFKALERPQKPKMLVVDDEPDNLDLLYRTFRRDFTVLRAESGIAALELLATEGEVAVIISDQRMPEMKGTEFLSRTVPQFPDTMRIILTGFTDVEDLVEAINSGQVYKYITKPWDPQELKAVVQRAVDTYDVQKQRMEELRQAQSQTALLEAIVQSTYESSSLETCLEKISYAYGTTFSADCCILQLVEATGLGVEGVFCPLGLPKLDLAQDALTEAVLTTRTMQAAISKPAEVGENQLPAHLLVPVLLRDEVLALLSLQWKQPYPLNELELEMIHRSALQVGMAITYNQYRSSH